MIDLRKTTNQEQWDDYVLEHAGHPLQLWGWGQVKAAHGWSVDRIFAYDQDDKIIAAAQLLTRKLPLPLRAISYVPRGPVGEGAYSVAFLNELAAYATRTYKSMALSIEPDTREFDIPKGWLKSTHRILPPDTIELDLTLSENDLLNAMAKKTRQYIRKSAAEAIEIRTVKTREQLDSLLAIYRGTSQRAKFALHNDQYYIDVFNLMGDNSQVFAAFVEGKPVAFLWLAVSADTAFELYGGMNDIGQELRINYALKWHAIRKMREWGIGRYDLGGLINDGVSTFKRSWAEHETVLAGTFDKPLSPFYGIWKRGLPVAKSVYRGIKSLRK